MKKILVMIACLLFVYTDVQAQAIKDADLEKVKASLPTEAFIKPISPRKVLIYTKTTGFHHSSIALGAETLRLMGEKTGAYTATISEDSSNFEPEKIKEFDALIFLSTTGELFDLPPKTTFESLAPDEQARQKRLRQSLIDFVHNGKGLVGIHAATDVAFLWKEYGEMIGGYFDYHPWTSKVLINLEEPDHKLVQFMGVKQFEIADEIYVFKAPYDRSKLRILMSLDDSSKNGKGKRTDNDYPIAWIRDFGKGRVFYCSLGHREEIYWNPVILKLYLSGIQYATGDIQADASPRNDPPKLK